MTDSTAWILAPDDLGASTLDAWIAAIEAADAAGWPMVLLEAAHADDPLDGLALASFCASRTRNIGLCATIDPDTVEPFTLARGLATLDHLSGARAGWRLTDTTDAARTAELASVVSQLLQSWGADALIADRDAGLLSDTEKVAAIDHQGDAFVVRGPLNIPRPPQGVPPRIALPGDAIAGGADLTLDAAHIVRCSVADIAALPLPAPGHAGNTLRTRLGLAA